MSCSLCLRTAQTRPRPSRRRFTNDRPKPATSVKTACAFCGRCYFANQRFGAQGGNSLQRITPAQLQAAPNGSIYRLGHSTLLLKLRDRFWLTDPVFSQRASPVQWFGPKRFHAPPIALADLPPIEAVILSHNHYDHLDRHAVLALAHKTRMF